MAVAAVVFNGTRVFGMDTNTNIGHWVGSGGTPASEAQNAYQNSLAVNKKVTASVLTGIDYDPAAGAIDMTLATGTHPLCFVKVYVADFGDVDATFGVSYGIGSASTAYHKYNIAGTGSKLSTYNIYPPQGGYILTAIAPDTETWRDSTTGVPALGSVDWFGAQCAMVVGSAKSENFAIDAIDCGTGLTITAGDGGSAEGNFPSFVAADQDATAVRWGCVSGAGNTVNAWCLLIVGTAAVTEFLDDSSIVNFKDGYHAAGLTGVVVDLTHASTIVQIDCTLIGEGTVQVLAAEDTRPDFTVRLTSGSFNSAANIRNFRNITYTSVCDVENADIECQLLVQGSSNISNGIIRTNAITSIACLQDPIFGTTTDLHDVEFIQTGVGHALELDTATTYSFTNLTFTGYGITTSDSAALDVTAISGTVTINISGGTSSPTYKTAGATVDIVSTVNVTLDKLKDNSEIRVMEAGSNTVELDGIDIATSGTSGNRNFTFGLAAGTSVDIYIVNVLYENIEIYAYSIPATATTLPQQQRFDRSYLNN